MLANKKQKLFNPNSNEYHYHRPLLHPDYRYPCIVGRTFVSNKNKTLTRLQYP